MVEELAREQVEESELEWVPGLDWELALVEVQGSDQESDQDWEQVKDRVVEWVR
jgi:hypothetical protein